jgi:hypothetical protein
VADLDEFLKPEVGRDVVEKDGQLHTVWLIPFTQYLLPNGRKRPEQYMTPNKDVADKARLILDAGFYFEAEILMNGFVSFTIGGKCQLEKGDEPEDQDLAFAICPNGPQVTEKVDGMIRNFQIPEDGIVRKWS